MRWCGCECGCVLWPRIQVNFLPDFFPLHSLRSNARCAVPVLAERRGEAGHWQGRGALALQWLLY